MSRYFTRYPDPRIEALDRRFKYKIGNAAIAGASPNDHSDHHRRMTVVTIADAAQILLTPSLPKVIY
jgi:hypothetical protein